MHHECFSLVVNTKRSYVVVEYEKVHFYFLKSYNLVFKTNVAKDRHPKNHLPISLFILLLCLYIKTFGRKNFRIFCCPKIFVFVPFY